MNGRPWVLERRKRLVRPTEEDVRHEADAVSRARD